MPACLLKHLIHDTACLAIGGWADVSEVSSFTQQRQTFFGKREMCPFGSDPFGAAEIVRWISENDIKRKRQRQEEAGSRDSRSEAP